MTRVLRWNIAILIIALFGCATHSPEEMVIESLREDLASIVSGYHAVHGFSGTVHVARGNTEAYSASVGLCERSFATPCDIRTRYSINSISKAFTAVAILRLAERGLLDLKAPVGQYLPEFSAPWGASVTLHHLLSHSAGLPREAGLSATSEQTLAEQLNAVASLELLFAPGSAYGYSNAGYIVLGNVLERVAGADYAEIIHREVIAPARLADTGVYVGQAVVSRQAVPYRLTAQGIEQAQRTKTRGESAGGGIYSTPADLHRFLRALEDDTLLGPAMRARLFAPHQRVDDQNAEAYAFSLKTFGDRKVRFAAGSGYGSKSALVRIEDTGEFIGVTSNWGNTPILALLRDLFLRLTGESVAPPDIGNLADPADFEAKHGRYQFDADLLRQTLQAEDSVLRLHAVEGKLFLDDELLAKGVNGTLRLTYTNELLIRFEGEDLVLDIAGQVLRGERLRR